MDTAGYETEFLLGRYLNSRDPHEESRLLERLALEIRKPVSRILSMRFGGSTFDQQRAEDACQDCMVAILGKIDRLKKGNETEPVGSLGAYAAMTAQNAYRGEIRQQNPERARMRQRIIDTISSSDRLAIWKQGSCTLCGLSSWRGSGERMPAEFAIRQPGAPISTSDLAWRIWSSEKAAARDLEQYFHWIGTPLQLGELVTHLAQATQSRGASGSGRGPGTQEDGDDIDPLEQIPDVIENVEERVVDHLHRERLLRAAWDQIVQLPVRQRTALLMALPSEAFLAYRLLVGRQAIAQALELSPLDVDGLPASLPRSDADLAEQMGVTRQQVINLRLSARQRLARNLPQ